MWKMYIVTFELQHILVIHHYIYIGGGGGYNETTITKRRENASTHIFLML